MRMYFKPDFRTELYFTLLRHELKGPHRKRRRRDSSEKRCKKLRINYMSKQLELQENQVT